RIISNIDTIIVKGFLMEIRHLPYKTRIIKKKRANKTIYKYKYHCKKRLKKLTLFLPEVYISEKNLNFDDLLYEVYFVNNHKSVMSFCDYIFDKVLWLKENDTFSIKDCQHYYDDIDWKFKYQFDKNKYISKDKDKTIAYMNLLEVKALKFKIKKSKELFDY